MPYSTEYNRLKAKQQRQLEPGKVFGRVRLGQPDRFQQPQALLTGLSRSDIAQPPLQFYLDDRSLRPTGPIKFGRYWIRTSGPHYVKVVRYQLRQPSVEAVYFSAAARHAARNLKASARSRSKEVCARRKERRHPDSNWGIKVLQTSALPLGYAATWTMPPQRQQVNIVRGSRVKCQRNEPLCSNS